MDAEEETKKVITGYWHNISNFFKSPIKWDLLTSQNQGRMKMVVELAENYRKTLFYEGRSLN
jgi:hypothetical protein